MTHKPGPIKPGPFELKDELTKPAHDRTQGKSASMQFLNAGRCNPDWTATVPREAFFLLGQFALTQCKRDWNEPDLRSTRLPGGLTYRNNEVNDDKLGFVASLELNPAKSRVLLQQALLVTKDPQAIQKMFAEY